MSSRLPPQSGEWIARNREIRFYFENQEYPAYQGDTISSAIWAAGTKVLGRSFKYHRPRGILSFANHDVNIMVKDRKDTNIRGDVVKVKDGMHLFAVNTSGGVKKDRKRYLDLISKLLPVGFYYKAFHTPRILFPFWENIIRKAAGLGVVNFRFPRITKPKLHRFCDVLVVGAGPSGMTAALTAADAGLNVFLADEGHQLGGSLTYDHADSDHNSHLLQSNLKRLTSHPRITIFTATYAAGYYTDHLVPLVHETGMIKVRAKAMIVTTGAFEQPPVFRNNDIPGVMLGSAAQRLIYHYATKPFEHGVVFTANDYGYRVALDLINADVKVMAIVDLRAGVAASESHRQIIELGVPVYHASCIYEVIPTRDKMAVKAVIICPYDETNHTAEHKHQTTISCDGVAMCAGWAGASGLLYQAGTSMYYSKSLEQFIPDTLPAGIFAAGKVNGIYDLDLRLLDGARAAHEAMQFLGIADAKIEVGIHNSNSPSHPYPIVPHPKGKNFVDFDEDLTLQDFFNAAQEGFNNIELMKRYTTVGMGPSQGKHSNMNAIRILAKIKNLPVEKVGTTTSRPFFHPTPIGHLAGRSFHPHRHTVIHSWHLAAEAVFTTVGAWQRPAYYQKAGEKPTSLIEQEALAVRRAVGLIDSSTLGKIEICGPESAVFLERFYTGSFSNLAVGKSRYALLLDESGVVIDDGVAARLSPELFYVTTSTANSASVYREMQRWQQIWQLDLALMNVTSAYAAINLAGPKARSVLSDLCTLDLSDTNFPPSAIRETKIADINVRVIRVAFVAEIAYEIHVSSADGLSLWNAITATGLGYGLRHFGTEAQRLLRLEMGHPLVGHDTDGLTNPFEINAEWAIDMKKPYFIGKRSLLILQKKTLKKQLVPFVLINHSSSQVPKDCNLVIKAGEIKGRVTSIAFSSTLRKFIGLAFIDPEMAQKDSKFEIRCDSGVMVQAQVAATPFIKMGQGHE